jgi:predicted transcriptional regulator
MSPVKQQVIEMIQALPDESTIDDIMAELYFRTKVDRGLKELDEGQTVSHEAVKERLSQWPPK